jgi:hypothetical protein
MQFFKKLNANYTFHLKVIEIHKYIQCSKNLGNKKIPKIFKVNIHSLVEGEKGPTRMGHHHCHPIN